MLKRDKLITFGLLTVMATLAVALGGCRERIRYDDDDYDHRPHKEKRHHDDDWDDRTLNGTGRILFGNKGCNMSRVTAYWDGNRRVLESNIPDKDGYYIIRDLPLDRNVLLVAEFDYYSKHYVAKETVRTPRRGGKVNLGVMSFRQDDRWYDRGRHGKNRHGKDRHDRPKHYDNVRVQGWVTYKGAAVDDVQVYMKTKDRPAWREVDKTDRVGKFNFKNVPYDEKVDLKFIKTTRGGTYSGTKSIRPKSDNYDVGTVKLKYSESRDERRRDDDKRRDHRDGRRDERKGHRGRYDNASIQGWVTYKGSAVENVNIYLKSKSSPKWGVVASTNRQGRFLIRKAPFDETVELKFVKDTRGGTYSANKKVKVKDELKDVGTVKLKFHERKRKR